MVDVGEKAETEREAVARGLVRMQAETLRKIKNGMVKKGDVLAVAQVAAVQGAKRTSDLIPLCHPLRITGVDVRFDFPSDRELAVEVTVRALDRTGVEMEALTAAAVACLTIYDMCKSVDRGMEIAEVVLWKKTGGKSGVYLRDDAG